MAWGFFNKIKNGMKKAFNFGKKALSFVNNKVIKPFKPIISGVAKSFNPLLGKVVDRGMDIVDKIDEGGAGDALSWGKRI